jgi:DNA-binding MarR family transcriptional regulator
MSTATPASFAQFGQSLAFAEQTLTEVLVKHLALRGVEPGTWYALKLIGGRGPAVPRAQLITDLSRSRTLSADSAADVLARLDADGLIHGDTEISLTPAGEAFFADLRAYVFEPTARLLGQLDPSDVETTIRTIQAITQRAIEEENPSRPGCRRP